MAAILTNLNKIGNFLVQEQWSHLNYCRNMIEVDMFKTGGGHIEMGDVVYRNAANKADEFIRPLHTATLPATIEVAIIVDTRILDAKFINLPVDEDFGSNPVLMGQVAVDWSGTEHETVTLAAITRGDAIVREGGLTFGNIPEGHASRTALVDALKAQGIQVVKHSKDLYGIQHPFN